MVRIRNERKATMNAVRAQELLIENIPDPPKDDEVEETLRKWKRLNQENEVFDDKNEVAVEKEMEIEAMKVKVVNDKIKDVKVDENGHEDFENETFDDKNEIVCEDCTKSSIKIKIENAENESEEKISENLYDKIVPESVFIDDVMGMHDDMKCMQVPSGTVKEVEVDKRINASTVVSFLLIIFAMVQLTCTLYTNFPAINLS